MESKGDNETTTTTTTTATTTQEPAAAVGNVQNASTIPVDDSTTQATSSSILPNSLRRVIYKGGSFILRNYLSEQKRQLESEIHLNRRQYRSLLTKTGYKKALIDRGTKQLIKVNDDIAAIDARTARDDDADDDDQRQVAREMAENIGGGGSGSQDMEVANVVVEQAAPSPSSVQLSANEARNHDDEDDDKSSVFG